MTDYERIAYRPKLFTQQPVTRRIVWILNSLLAITFAVGVAVVATIGYGWICFFLSQ